MSFNRARFLGPVLASLKAQRSNGMDGREVHLFQDGAVNRYSRLQYAKPADIQESITLFKQEFPDGVIHESADNIGICENFKRAEEYLFAERGFECAWFFEDDLVLSPVYFQMMERLQNFAEIVGNVAYFAAYGNHYAPPDEVAHRRRELMTLDHHWGFGLLARHWRTLQPSLAPFYDVVVGTDYSRRDHRRIFEIYQASPGSPRASSQDAAKAYACDRMGLWRCNTVVSFAKYIGTSGQHMTPEIFREMGLDKVVIAQEPVLDLALPGPAGIRERVLEQRHLYELVRRNEFDQLIRNLPAKAFNPMRLCTRADIEAAYRLLLRRRVENDRIVTEHAGKLPVQVLLSAIRQSKEFRDFTDEAAAVFTFKDAASRGYCSAEDVYTIYALLVHREPERNKAAEYVGITRIDQLVEGILGSNEFRSLNERFRIEATTGP